MRCLLCNNRVTPRQPKRLFSPNALSLLALFLWACGEGGFNRQPENLGVVSTPIIGGHASEEAAVVALQARNELLCSATLIAPQVLLTAAHCVQPTRGFDPLGLRALAGDDAANPWLTLQITDYWVPPEWHPLYDDHDIGLLRLEAPTDLGPLALPRSSQPEPGEVVTAIGFGAEAHDGLPNGSRREVDLVISDVEGSLLTLAGDGSTCHGDSGGPLVRYEDSRVVVVGIHARSDCDSGMLATRVSAYLPAIEAFVESPPPSEDRESPPRSPGCSTAHSIPERAKVWLAIVGLLFVLCLRLLRRGARWRAFLPPARF